MNTIVIIDGFAVLHRAFHAIPPMTNSKGEMTNAVYGFATMLMKVVNDLAPTHIIVAFDRPKPTFRKKMYADYQAKRPKMDEGLAGQIEKVRRLIAEFGITLLEKDGYEADDVIGTIAKKTKKDMETIIMTGDRDLLQLVNSHVKVYMPVKGVTEAKLYSEKEVEEKFHITSSQMVDYKALVGDASDNYPGVSGIGPKTASELLQQFKTLEGIYKHINKIANERVRNLLKQEEKAALMAKKLATIVTDVPIDIDFTKCMVKSFDRPNVHQFFDEMEFFSLITRLGSKSSNKLSDTKEKKIIAKEKENQSQQISLF